MHTLSDEVNIFTPDEKPPTCHYQAPLLALPHAFGTVLGNIPAYPSYLRTDGKKFHAWKKIICDSNGQLKIGLACSGNPEFKNDRNRSIPLGKFAPLISDKYRFYLIQKGIRAEDEIFLANTPTLQYLGNQLSDFDDTAACVAQMDIIISVDTSLVHLAGALGKPVWVLLPWAPEWRWLLDREDSPWYPTARLFRQQTMGDWAGAIERVVNALNTYQPRNR
jgi:ADP-heptose:LPS heptosyltransferase